MIGAMAARFMASAIGRAIMGTLAALVVVALYLRRRDRRAVSEALERVELEQLREDAQTRGRMDAARTYAGDPASDRKWLFRRGLTHE